MKKQQDLANKFRNSHVAVIGSGISGLSCAGDLQQQGLEVTVYDKARSAGGRMSTRRTDDGYEFDHGCQFFCGQDEVFLNHLMKWKQDGIVDEWCGEFGLLHHTNFTKCKGTQRFVGVPGMNAICKYLARDLDVRQAAEVTSLRRTETQWAISVKGHPDELFDLVVISTPPLQAARLIGDSSSIGKQCIASIMNSCWTLMIAFDKDTGLEFDGAIVEESPLMWIARNSSKPGRANRCEQWVLQASPDWSRANLEVDVDQVKKRLLEAFYTVTGMGNNEARYSTVHLWRYATPRRNIRQDFLFDSAQFIAICGDWFARPNVEGAFLSGFCLARSIQALDGSK
ncbi:MAG: FAD-dependent oxidoreductase [Planctomyces sp.]|nr:FAD-dependent oxidoreductase [Planctomyces sp.]